MTEIPPAWREAPLSVVAEVRVSNVDKQSRRAELPVRLCNYLDVYREDYLDATHVYMEATATYAEIRKFGLARNDVVITKDSESPYDIGVAAVIETATDNLVCGYHLAILRPSDRVDAVWLAKQLGGTRVQRYLSARATGTTRYGLSNASLASLPTWLPPRKEQDQMADVFRALDETIRRSEDVIAKLDLMKQGLIHDLLTRGIAENGELRDADRHPEQFKTTPLGPLPKDWAVSSMADLMQPGRGVTYGIVQPGPFTRGGVLLIRGQDYINGWQPPEVFFRVALPLHRQYSRSTTGPDDVLLTIVGATTGATAIVPEWIDEANITQTTARLAFDRRLVVPRFGRAVLDSELGQSQVRRHVKGSAQPGLNLGDIEVFFVPVPPMAEQEAITGIIESAASRSEREGRQLEKLRLLKRGLSEDLLTGKVRVTTLLKE
jgi:type I restriction enzyme, S subunit